MAPDTVEMYGAYGDAFSFVIDEAAYRPSSPTC